MKDPKALQEEFAHLQAPESEEQAPTPVELPEMEAVPNPADILAALQPKEEPDPSENPKAQRDCVIALDFTDDASGERFQGTFTNRILSVHQRMLVATVRSQMTNGVALEALSGAEAQLADAVSHMAVSLVKKENHGGWADNFNALLNPAPIIALFGEVLDHEDTFRRLSYRASKGTKAS